MQRTHPILEIDRLSVFYGAIQALKRVSLKVEAGQIVSLIGTNGAGKSSLMKAIVGVVKANEGDIRFNAESILSRSSHQIIRSGIGVSPEGRQIFADMTVEENLTIGAYSKNLRKEALREKIDEILLLFPILRERCKQLAVTLSGGEQQMLAIGRAIILSPKLLLLDEPSLGVSPLLTEKIFEILKRLNEKGTSILLAEQNALMALEISHKGYVLEVGEIIYEDTASNLISNDVIKKSYLGV